MTNLSLVCQHLHDELPHFLQASNVKLHRLIALTDKSFGEGQKIFEPDLLLNPDQVFNAQYMEVKAWLDVLKEWRSPVPALPTPRSLDGHEGHLRLVQALKAAGATPAEGHAVILIGTSPLNPEELETCATVLEKKRFTLHVVGVVGASDQDAEPILQQLASSARGGSSVQLFFGQQYWTSFAAAQHEQLKKLSRLDTAKVNCVGETSLPLVEEAFAPEMLEIRVLERVLQECFYEEQSCEEEILCAQKLLGQDLLDDQD